MFRTRFHCHHYYTLICLLLFLLLFFIMFKLDHPPTINRPNKYNLFHHNCNNFTNEVALFLTGKEIPQEILNLPNEVLSTYVSIRIFFLYTIETILCGRCTQLTYVCYFFCALPNWECSTAYSIYNIVHVVREMPILLHFGSFS